MVKRVKAKEKLGKISSQNKKLQNNLVKIKKGRGWNFNKKAVLLQFSRYRNSYKLLNKRRKR